MKKIFFNNIMIAIVACISLNDMVAAMEAKKAVPASKQMYHGTGIGLEDKTLEMAIHDIWSGYFFLVRSVDQSVIAHYRTREAVIQALLKQAISQSRFMLELRDKQAIIEQVMLSFALYGDKAHQHDFALFRAADDLTKNKHYFEQFATYFSDIGQMMKDFSGNCTRESLSKLEKSLEHLASQVAVPAAMRMNWDYFQNHLTTLISEDFFASIYQKDAMSYACMRADFIADFFTMFANRFQDQGVAETITNTRLIGEFLFSDLSYVDLDWCPCPVAPLAKRVALAIHIIDDVVKQHSDKRKQLVYTSLASGQLLMDFLVISGLKQQGFDSIDINLIDLDIKDKDTITAMLDELEGKRERLKEQVHDVTQQRVARQIEDEEYKLHDVLENSVAQAVFEKAVGAQYSWSQETVQNKRAHANRGIHVTIWDNTNNYIEFAQQHPQYMADVVMLVDAGGVHKTTNYGQADGVAFVETQQALELADQEIDIKELDDITVLRSASKYAVQKGKKNVFARNKLIYIPFLQCHSGQIYTNLDLAGHGVRLYQSIIKKYADQPITQDIAEDIVRRFRRHGYDIVWISDAYVAYANIICNAVKSDSLIYTLDAVKRDAFLTMMQRFTPEYYLQQPGLIDPDMHRELVDVFKYDHYMNWK